ncbi:hypothetical protein SAMN05192529_102165 [Arachidicoccus rhizosphaerae]|uniref:Uncharacterized protein n=1 Tax=Arachidicoccus rhizosphaerae TaxID=551991 RepID=A0A1H3W627_9BACT|nr:hypothetical protein SAMN05192529_102165 [Arachidicoccus rhizosphaerae]
MEYQMKKTIEYIQEILGIHATITQLAKSYLERLPIYLWNLQSISS